MTKKQIENYNRMRLALKEITQYQTPEKMQKESFEDWGLEYEECIEMAYENIQETARMAVKGVRAIKE